VNSGHSATLPTFAPPGWGKGRLRRVSRRRASGDRVAQQQAALARLARDAEALGARRRFGQQALDQGRRVRAAGAAAQPLAEVEVERNHLLLVEDDPGGLARGQ
jgi:hypothetical protein